MKNSPALSFALIAYVIVVLGVWAYCSVKVGVMAVPPDRVLYIGGILVAAVTGDSTWKNRKPNGNQQ